MRRENGESRKNPKHGTVLQTLVFLFIILISIINMSLPSKAHDPTEIELEYDYESQVLSVTVTHIVVAPDTHYVEYVEISKNGAPYDTYNYTGQPTTSTFTYEYPVPAVNGDVLSVLAQCSIDGSVSGEITVVEPSKEEDTMNPLVEINDPEIGEFVTTEEITVEGTASDNVELGSVEVRVNDGNWREVDASAAWSTQVELEEGENLIEARAIDTSGNEALDSVTVTYQPPEEGNDTGDEEKVSSPGFRASLAIVIVMAIALILSRIKRRRSG